MVARDRVLVLQQEVLDAERGIENQVAAGRHADSKAGHVGALGVGVLGVAVTGSLFWLQANRAPVWFGAAFGLGVFLNSAALLMAVEAYVGFRRPRSMFTAPEPAWLESRASDPAWGFESHCRSLLATYRLYSAENRNLPLRSNLSLRRGVFLLTGAVVSYVWSLPFILGVAIHV